jgi:IS1 family transposase
VCLLGCVIPLVGGVEHSHLLPVPKGGHSAIPTHTESGTLSPPESVLIPNAPIGVYELAWTAQRPLWKTAKSLPLSGEDQCLVWSQYGVSFSDGEAPWLRKACVGRVHWTNPGVYPVVYLIGWRLPTVFYRNLRLKLIWSVGLQQRYRNGNVGSKLPSGGINSDASLPPHRYFLSADSNRLVVDALQSQECGDSCSQTDKYQRPVRPRWWRYGIGPIPRLFLSFAPVIGGFLLIGERSYRRRGWCWLLLACCLPLLGIVRLCLFLDWLYFDAECEHQQPQKQESQSQHGRDTVTQKLLTIQYYCNTVIAVGRARMANVLSIEKQVAIISASAERSGTRQIERITGVHRDTIMRLGVRVGKRCASLMDSKMRDSPCENLQLDETWGFIGKKQKHVQPEDSADYGDVWTFCAIDSDTKLVPSFKVGKRDMAAANAFVSDVASRMKNRIQISTDGLPGYVEAIERAFGTNVDYPQVVKVYESEAADAEVVRVDKRAFAGRPDMNLASTSHVERLNGTTRLHMRRLTRLTYAFSKKLENFEAAVALHFAYYNFVKRHNALRATPATAAGVARDLWTVENLVEATL